MEDNSSCHYLKDSEIEGLVQGFGYTTVPNEGIFEGDIASEESEKAKWDEKWDTSAEDEADKDNHHYISVVVFDIKFFCLDPVLHILL